jgi:hypothetical protein
VELVIVCTRRSGGMITNADACGATDAGVKEDVGDESGGKLRFVIEVGCTGGTIKKGNGGEPSGLVLVDESDTAVATGSMV